MKTKSTKSKLVAKLDGVLSKFIRWRDSRPNASFRCISCGRVLPIDQADCGHYINRQHMSTRFNEKNCNAQCHTCNRFNGGNLEGYRQGLIAKYGESIVSELESRKNELTKYSESDLKEMINHYQKELKS
ncbi:recombination protein NinG [Bacteroides reticulotermitis]|uniref:recombination protein NinG n=1 Tax=Bacteroides reticulotermitis TaxID=1133319 RepID=UPI003A87517E